MYIFLIFIIPVYVGWWVYNRLGGLDQEQVHKNRNKWLGILAGIGVVLLVVLIIVLLSAGGSLLAAPIAYAVAIKRHLE